jgi:hypothetical protein
MRALRVSALTVGVFSLVGCDGGSRPFSLFGRQHLRPGIRMAKLEKVSRAESRYPFKCSPLWARAQQCVMKIAPGDLRVVVDSTGRVIRLTVVAPDSFFVWEETPRNEPIYRYRANELKRAWDAIRPHERLTVEPSQQVEYRWIADQRWAAQMWYSPWARYRTRSELLRQAYRDSLTRVPDSIAVTDAPAFDKLMEQHPVLELLDSK